MYKYKKKINLQVTLLGSLRSHFKLLSLLEVTKRNARAAAGTALLDIRARQLRRQSSAISEIIPFVTGGCFIYVEREKDEMKRFGRITFHLQVG